MTKDENTAAEAAPEDMKKLWDEVDAPPATDPQDLPEDKPETDAPSEEAATDEGTAETEQDLSPSNEADSEPDEETAFLSSLSEEQQETFNRMIAEREAKTQAELKRERGRQAGLQRALQEARQAKPSDPPPQKEADTEVNDLSEEYPEIAEWIEAKVAGRVGKLEAEVGTMSEARQQEFQQTLDDNEALVADVVPNGDLAGFFKEYGSDLNDWIETEASVSDARTFEANKEGFVDPDGAIRVIERFKAFQGLSDQQSAQADKTSARRRAQMKSAASPNIHSKSAATGIPRDGDKKAIWDATVV
jgi:type II secretory pathway pseudopilin PulG